MFFRLLIENFPYVGFGVHFFRIAFPHFSHHGRSGYQSTEIPLLSILISMSFLLSLVFEKIAGAESASAVSQIHVRVPFDYLGLRLNGVGFSLVSTGY